MWDQCGGCGYRPWSDALAELGDWPLFSKAESALISLNQTRSMTCGGPYRGEGRTSPMNKATDKQQEWEVSCDQMLTKPEFAPSTKDTFVEYYRSWSEKALGRIRGGPTPLLRA